eukprot:GILK01009842.1.p1 GENE.GILK01009842.1~~GILK01009842.1.p1  ORF type:complete len:356 (+),score=34.26 GILK01009842.1:446-1513(+)
MRPVQPQASAKKSTEHVSIPWLQLPSDLLTLLVRLAVKYDVFNARWTTKAATWQQLFRDVKGSNEWRAWAQDRAESTGHNVSAIIDAINVDKVKNALSNMKDHGQNVAKKVAVATGLGEGDLNGYDAACYSLYTEVGDADGDGTQQPEDENTVVRNAEGATRAELQRQKTQRLDDAAQSQIGLRPFRLDPPHRSRSSPAASDHSSNVSFGSFEPASELNQHVENGNLAVSTDVVRSRQRARSRSSSASTRSAAASEGLAANIQMLSTSFQDFASAYTMRNAHQQAASSTHTNLEERKFSWMQELEEKRLQLQQRQADQQHELQMKKLELKLLQARNHQAELDLKAAALRANISNS